MRGVSGLIVTLLVLTLVLGIEGPSLTTATGGDEETVRLVTIADPIPDRAAGPDLDPSVPAAVPTAEPLVERVPVGRVDADPTASDGAGSTDRAPTEPEPSDAVPDAVPYPRTDLAAALPLPAAAPARVDIPTLGVSSSIVDVGLEPDGALEVPEDVQTIGWYVPPSGRGVVPGSTGTAVLAGHVDSRTQGPGAFSRLRTLALDDPVVVIHADGASTLWRVTEVVRYPKSEVPIGEIFVWDGAPRLALITCGGEFDRQARSYQDNYVVLATRVG